MKSSAELKIFILRPGHYRLSNVFVNVPGTMRPSNNTANGGRTSVSYNGRFVVPSIRAKTLNPLFNSLDQFSSTHIPLQHSRIMTGYIHFILKFAQKQTANKSEMAFLPISGRVLVVTRSASAALTSRLNQPTLIVYQHQTTFRCGCE